MAEKRIVIIGGYGTFGRLIAEELVSSGAQVFVAGRNAARGPSMAASIRAGFVHCDAGSDDSLRAAVAGAWLVINASGPFQAKDYAIPRVCIENGCHYIDLGDGRDYVIGIAELHERARAADVFVCAGASTTPAVTSAAAAELLPLVDHPRSIDIALTAGNKNQAGVSTIASILAYVGTPVRVWQNGAWREVSGWGLGEFIEFPPPVGRRRVQLCDVPDLELFPGLFGVDCVTFKAGVEITAFNYAIAATGLLRRLRLFSNLPALAGPLVRLSGMLKFLGTFHGSVAVCVRGESGQERTLAFVAPNNGPRVPSSPAVLLARKLLAGGIPARGAFPCLGFLGLAEFTEYLAPFGIFVVRGENGAWASTEIQPSGRPQ